MGAMLTRLLLATACVACAAISARWAWSDLVAVGPRSLMEEVADKRVPLKSRDWITPYRLIESSLGARPWDENLRFEAGRLAWWQALHVERDPQARSRWLGWSAEHLQAAVTGRPTWGLAWAELANVYLQQGDYLRARSALLKAMALEPNEGPTQWMMLWTGFAIWPMLLSDDRAQLLAIASNALANNMYDWVIDPAVQFGRESVVRPLIPAGDSLHKHLTRLVKARDRQQQRAVSDEG